MSDINTVNLFNQIQSMSAKAEGTGIETEFNAPPFSSIFQNALNQVNELTQKADFLKTRFELGDSKVAIGEVMIASQKSNLGMEAVTRVRNKIVQAYQDIMSMPV